MCSTEYLRVNFRTLRSVLIKQFSSLYSRCDHALGFLRQELQGAVCSKRGAVVKRVSVRTQNIAILSSNPAHVAIKHHW